ncbi:hypothetical protein BH11CYA1_BH11CYA1_23670 [soil metagenome]
MNSKNWKEILEFARWAPSPHNIQSWRFRIDSETQLTLMFDPSRLLPDTDPTGRFCTLGFGLLIEYMSIAAAPLGLAVEAEYLTALDASKNGLQAYATLTLVPRTKAETLDRQLILTRRTSRLPYHDRPLDPALMAELSAIAQSFGHQMEFSQEPTEVAWVVRLNADTMFYDMSDPLARNEVGGWIRFSMAEAKRRADGLAAYAMHFPGLLMRLFVKQNWIFRLPGIYHITRALYIRSMKGTRTVSWISGPFVNQQECDNTGRMLGRLWLTMTKAGVYLHPFGSVITNAKAHKVMADHFQNADRKDDLWLLLRLGHSDLPPSAQRLTLDQLLVA